MSYGTPLPPAPGTPPPPGPTTEPIRPSAWWFGAAGAVAALGIVIAVVLWVRTALSYQDKIDDFQRVDVPGEGEVDLDGTGGYTIYHEYPGADDDFSFTAPSLRSVTLIGPDGDEIRLESYDSRVTYTDDSQEGIAEYSFHVDDPGVYELSAEGESATLAVGRGLGRGLVAGIVGGFAAAGIGVIAGIVMAIVVGVQRSKDRRRKRPYGAPPPGYGAPAWGVPAGYGAPPGYGAPGYGPPPGYGTPPGYGAPGYTTPPGYGAPGYGAPPPGHDPGTPPPGAGGTPPGSGTAPSSGAPVSRPGTTSSGDEDQPSDASPGSSGAPPPPPPPPPPPGGQPQDADPKPTRWPTDSLE